VYSIEPRPAAWFGIFLSGPRRGNVVIARSGALNMKLSNVIQYLVIAAVAAAVIANIPDIKRYIKISMM
jgi:hypothetical protein